MSGDEKTGDEKTGGAWSRLDSCIISDPWFLSLTKSERLTWCLLIAASAEWKDGYLEFPAWSRLAELLHMPVNIVLSLIRKASALPDDDKKKVILDEKPKSIVLKLARHDFYNPLSKQRKRQYKYRAQRRIGRDSERKADVTGTSPERSLSHPHDNDTDTTNVVSGENGASANAGQPESNGHVPWKQQKVAEDLVLMSAVNLWNEYATRFAADRVPTVNLKSIINGNRRNPTVRRLKEIEEEGYSFEGVLAGLTAHAFYRGKGNNGWVADFNWLIGPDTKWQQVADRALFIQEPQDDIPIRDITDTLSPRRRSAMLGGAANGNPGA